MTSFDETMVEELLEKPYWIIDILPKQVPKDSAGQYSAVEQYYLQKSQITELRRKYLTILLKLNCYYDLAVSTDCGDHWDGNPAPHMLQGLFLSDVNVCPVHVLIVPQNTLMVLDFYDTYMTVYDPAEDLLQMIRTLAGSEGLFVWQPESQRSGA